MSQTGAALGAGLGLAVLAVWVFAIMAFVRICARELDRRRAEEAMMTAVPASVSVCDEECGRGSSVPSVTLVARAVVIGPDQCVRHLVFDSL